MISSLCGRLRHIFQNKLKPTTATATTTPVRDERVQYMVQRFKEKSSFSNFRRFPSGYTGTVRRLAQSGQLSSIHEIIDDQKRFPEIKDEKFTCRLIILYGKAKMLDHAFKLFDEMPELNCPRTVLSLNHLMAACFPSRRFDKVIQLFQELPEKLSIKPDVITYGIAVRAHCEKHSLDEALILFLEIEKNGLKPDAVTFSSLLRAFYGTGRFSEAEDLWRLMDEKKITPDLKCYNSRLDGMVGEKHPGAMDLFKEIEEKGLKPNLYTYNQMIRLFVNEGNLEEVKKWYAKMINHGLVPNFITYYKIVPFASENDIDLAYDICKKSLSLKGRIPRIAIQKVIDKLTEHSKTDEAKEIFELYNSKSGLVLDSPQMSSDE